MSALWELDSRGKLTLNLHKGQAEAWRSERRCVIVLAGTQSGKTSFGPLWLWREIGRCGPGDYLVVTPTYPLLSLKALPEFLRLFEHTLAIGEYNAADRVFYLDAAAASECYGSKAFAEAETRVIFGSAKNPESLESATAKAAWLDECGQDQFKLESWEAVQRRLALNEGRVLGTTTPYSLGWLKQQVYDRWRAGAKDIDVVQFRSIDNPAFPIRAYRRAKRTLPSWKFSMFYDGQFDRPAGMVYDCFVDDYREAGGHKVHPFDVPPEWPRYFGVDPGAVHTGIVGLARDPQVNVMYLYYEALRGGMTTVEHVARMRADTAGTNVVSWVLGAKSEEQARLDWRSAGLLVQPPQVHDVEVGIGRVYSLLKSKVLYIFDSCVKVLDQMGTYSRVLDDAAQPTEKIKDKEDFHVLDALRYAAQAATQPAAAYGNVEREAAFGAGRPSLRER